MVSLIPEWHESLSQSEMISDARTTPSTPDIVFDQHGS